MFLINLIENSEIFTSKTTEQVEKIINMIQSVYGTGMNNINEIQFWQFKEIYETAHGVSHKDIITKFVMIMVKISARRAGKMSARRAGKMSESNAAIFV